jgi:hypothetical protein
VTTTEAKTQMSARHVPDLVAFLNAAGVTMTTKRRGQAAWNEEDEEECEEDGIGVRVDIQGCDGSDRHTREWAQARGIDDADIVRFLNRHRCPCDHSILEAFGDGVFGTEATN